MNIILPFDADAENYQDLLQLAPRIFTQTNLYFLFMGIDAEVRREYIPPCKIAVILGGEEFDFSKCIYRSLETLSGTIDSEEIICLTTMDYAVSFPQTRKQVKELNLDNCFLYYNIYEDISNLSSLNLTQVLHPMQNIFNRLVKLEKTGERRIKNKICLMKMYKLLQMTAEFEQRKSEFTLIDIYNCLVEEMELTPVEAIRPGLYIGKDNKESQQQEWAEKKDKIKPPSSDWEIRKALHKGIKPEKPTLESSIIKKSVGIVITFPRSERVDPERHLGGEGNWVTLIKLLDRTENCFIYIVGRYPWNKKTLYKFNSAFVIDEEKIKGIEDTEMDRYVILNSKLLFGIGYGNEFIKLANEVGTPNLYYSWFEEENLTDTFSIQIKQIGNKFNVHEIYKFMRDFLGI